METRDILTARAAVRSSLGVSAASNAVTVEIWQTHTVLCKVIVCYDNRYQMDCLSGRAQAVAANAAAINYDDPVVARPDAISAVDDENTPDGNRPVSGSFP